MEFTCKRAHFFKAIGSVETIIKNKLTFSPHLSNILLEVERDQLTIKASNREMTQKTTFEGVVQRAGVVSISHQRIYNILRQVPEGEIHIAVDDKHVMTITPTSTHRKYRIELLGIAPDDFFDIPAFPDSTPPLIFDKLYFKKMIQKVIFATSTEPTNYAIHGVLVEFSKQSISLVATDTRKMAIYKSDLPETSSIEESVLLPRDLLNHLSKLFLTEGPVSIAFHQERIFIRFEEYEISSTLVNGEFPQYDMFIPKSNEHTILAETASLLDAIGLGMTVYDDNVLRRIVFQLSNGELKLLSQGKEANQIDEVIAVQYQGKEFTIGFVVNMLLEVLKQVETEKVEIHFNSELSPFVMKEHNKKEATYIMMPVKLSQGS